MEQPLVQPKKKKNRDWLIVLGLGVLCLCGIGILAIVGYFAFSTPATPTATGPTSTIEFTTPLSNTTAIFVTLTSTDRPTQTSTSTITVTPEDTVTPSPTPSACMKHNKAVYSKVSIVGNNFIVDSTTNCFMMSKGGGSVGKPVIGQLKNEKIEILNWEYNSYYEYIIPISADNTAALGIYNEAIMYWEYAQNNIGWAQNNYKPGQYWFLMHFVPKPTRTPGG